MTNADKFKQVFGLYVTELWAKPECEFLEWLNADEQQKPCEDAVSRQDALDVLDGLQIAHEQGDYGCYAEYRKHMCELPSVTLKPDHSGDTTEMVEYDDCVSRQAVIDAARKVHDIFEGDYDTRTPYGVIFDVQDAVSKLPSVTPKTEQCNDAVSRRKAFEYFVSLWECIGTIMDREEWEDVCKTTANELPSVTPKRKTGRWILHPDQKNVYG